MTHIKFTSVLLLLALTFSIIAFGQSSTNKATKNGFAVLELFTSEGCSSCPPADDLMGKIQNEYKDKPVYVLSYHVDYWDDLGWKDVFSNADYTKRQYEYAKWLKKEPIYTPQLIINGKSDYIGSKETPVRGGITKVLSKPALVNLKLSIQREKSGVVVHYKVSGNSKSTRLVLALVQKSVKSNVKRGENEGKLLSHYQIVRNLIFQKLAVGEKGTLNVYFPKNFDSRNAEIIGFIQDNNTGAILGAVKSGF
ncbi:DUF1223 domain-containing protein [Flavobacterium sp. LB2P84]|uniref:DUF1223 domain-containing protein n=1 Tax=Flavobacterium yafengii TaxID=3041253 RepID=A0AAW6TPF1_9FLAO|nr:DUF1223 domain-containing protein [Flavobacterium yafengii]MDI5950326.1 DUF1223 domain-containing protein [Flavobacterium yafengii]MDI6033764.1 DUF1223 domain-containing protein [Flavobacterium yafengii]